MSRNQRLYFPVRYFYTCMLNVPHMHSASQLAG
jgi:hypothetical protein